MYMYMYMYKYIPGRPLCRMKEFSGESMQIILDI